MKATEVYERVTESIVAKLESGDHAPWSRPWSGSFGFPSNVETGNTYRGGNVIALWIAELDAEYPSSFWATYKQWAALGWQVRKGETATHLVKWIEPRGKDDGAQPGEIALNRRRLIPFGFAVFNVAQVDPIVARCTAPKCGRTFTDQTAADDHDHDTVPAVPRWQVPEVQPGAEPIEHAETFYANVGARVEAHPDRAFYAPGGDYIGIPPIASFADAVRYYATLGHEHVHWTGAKERLDRGLNPDHSTEAYAFEELVAEIGAAFLGAHLGIEVEPRDDHAAYVASWIKALNNDHGAIFKAATAAQKAVDYLVGRGEPAAEAVAA